MSLDLRAELPGGAQVEFTDRSDCNMSSVGGVDHERGEEARARLRDRLGLLRLARGYQVHGTVVNEATEMPDREAEVGELEHADGQATPLVGLGAMVLAADCLPVALAADRVVAMVHAGWRGLAGGVIENGVRAVRDLAPERTAGVVAVLGPCAGACCYEVGPEVHAALDSGYEGGGKALVDLRAIARRRLQAAGVETIGEIGGCTICDERYFSHRREGERAGRQAGVAWLS